MMQSFIPSFILYVIHFLKIFCNGDNLCQLSIRQCRVFLPCNHVSNHSTGTLISEKLKIMVKNGFKKIFLKVKMERPDIQICVFYSFKQEVYYCRSWSKVNLFCPKYIKKRESKNVTICHYSSFSN